MWMIAGLGNPERKYIGTRHNAGFAALDCLLEQLGGLKLSDTKYRGAYTKASLEGERLLLVKPLTYMNASGTCIAPLASYYKIPPEHIIVLVDDIALPVGRIRVRPKGSAGGHNGLKSIIQCLGTEDFPRVRMGVGNVRIPKESVPTHRARAEHEPNRDAPWHHQEGRMDLIAHVLSGFDAEQAKQMDVCYREAAEASLDMIRLGVDRAMNLHNGNSQKTKEDGCTIH